MPHALLLSPDDQAVSAITGVLEEMSVTCERPLDGVSAAQKLNSRSFDLVLVDCENLPAAKLIFDVCRRGKNGTNPVPIAIVDGRAGLPTAFRLGAELILTKPVAKDQARSTFRTAVSRLRKEEPARTAQAEEAAPVAAATPAQPEERAQAAAAAAAVSFPPVKISDGAPAAAASLPLAPAMRTAAEEIAVSAARLHEAGSPPKPFAAEDLLVASKPTPRAQLSDDPVLADLERGDVAPPPAAVFSSREASRSKSGNFLVATLILALAGGAVYAAWMYQPRFRALVQPQIDRVLALAGIASRQKAVPPPAPMQVPAQTSAKPTPTTTATLTASPTNATQPADEGAKGSPDAAPGLPAATPSSTTPALASAPAKANSESPTDSKKTEAAAASSDSELSGDEGAVVLSSKGAEKRLVHLVPPTLPVGASAPGLEGTVVLKTVVDDSGKVETVRLVEGNPALADAAIHAVKQWRYRPYVRNGKSVPFQTVVLIDFQRP
jgi:periplasmic protein TonB